MTRGRASRGRRAKRGAVVALAGAGVLGFGGACGLFPSLADLSDNYGLDASGGGPGTDGAGASDGGEPHDGGPNDANDGATNDAPVCPPDTSACGGRCVDLTRDRDNCGGCGPTHACGAAQICAMSTCRKAYFLSPNGDDSAGQGTETSPWKTFKQVLSVLQQGEAIVLLDGAYDAATTGLPILDCTNLTPATPWLAAPNGAALVAKNERRAALHANGFGAAIDLYGCSDWLIDGITADSADRSADAGGASSGGIVVVSNSSNVKLRRLLVSKTNRYFQTNDQGIFLEGVTNALVEESEIYAFVNYGLYVNQGSGSRVRRVYTNQSGTSLPDDAGVLTVGIFVNGFGGGDAIVENCIAEQGTTGIGVQNGGGAQRVLGSAGIGDWYGLGLNGGAGTIDVENFLSWPGSVRADQLSSSVSLVNATIIADMAFQVGSGTGTMSLTNVLAWVQGKGFNVLGTPPIPTITGDYTNIYGSGENYPPDGGFPPDAMSVQPSWMGPNQSSCVAYVPPQSNMKGVGADGGDIGANIVDRYEDGGLTSVKLFDPDGGRFPCGAVVAGVNDAPDASCSDVHTRLHIGTMPCPVP